MNEDFSLELLNGNWGIAAASLMVICALYLQHEFRSRRIVPFGQRRRFTDGMRVSISIFALSLGIFIRSATTLRWLISGGELNQLWLTIGGVIAIAGFLCAIREFSQKFYGRGPWIWTLVVMVGFTISAVAYRFW